MKRRLAEPRAHIDPDRLSPITRLRLLTSSTSRKEVARFVHHLQAFVDPLHLGRWWQNAPDVFYARLPEISPERRAYFARWLRSPDR